MEITEGREADADMNITKDTKLKDILIEFP